MLSKTVEYALRAMMHLASLQPSRSASSSAVASATHVPQGYLSKVLRDLVVAGLIDSQRGPNGGFCLSRPPSDISILDVINAVDPIPRIDHCPLADPNHAALCPLHQRLDDAFAAFEAEFRGLSLQHILDAGTARGHCTGMLHEGDVDND